MRPGVDIALRVADDRRLAGGATGGVNANDPVHRHGEHPKRVVLAQVVLGREGKFREVRERLQIVRADTMIVELAPVVGNVLVGMPEAPSEPLELQGAQLVDARFFDGLELIVRGHALLLACAVPEALPGLPTLIDSASEAGRCQGRFIPDQMPVARAGRPDPITFP